MWYQPPGALFNILMRPHCQAHNKCKQSSDIELYVGDGQA